MVHVMNPKLSEGNGKPGKVSSKKAKKTKNSTHKNEANCKKSKHGHKKVKKSIENDSGHKENRPLQVNTISGDRINRFYKTQRKIQIEEGMIEELQSSFK